MHNTFAYIAEVRMDLIRALRLFVAVSETGSFSEVGRATSQSASSIARQIDALEASLGTRLLSRTTRHIGLTEAGQRALVQSQQLLNNADRLINDIRGGATDPKGLLQLTAPPSIGRSVLPRILEGFLERYPNVEVDLLLTDDVISIREHGADIAIRVAELGGNEDLVVHQLLPMRRFVCASPKYIERYDSLDDPRQLVVHNCLLFRPLGHRHPWSTRSSTWLFQCNGKTDSVKVHGSISSSDADSLLDSARHGIGVVLLPDWMVAEDLRMSRLIRLLPEYIVGDPADQKQLFIAYSDHQRSSTNVRVFTEHARSWFAKKLVLVDRE